MHRFPVTVLALLLTTCQPSDGYVADVDQGPDAAALLAINLDDAFTVPAAAMPSDREPGAESTPLEATGAELLIDGKRVARIEVPSDGAMFEGHAAWQVPPGQDVTVEVELVGRGQHVRSKPLTVRADADSVIQVKASRGEDGKLNVAVENVAQLATEDGASVDYAKTNLPQARLPSLGAGPARALFAMLRDPQVAVVTPEAAHPDPQNHVGPLVAFAPIREVEQRRKPTTERPAPEATTQATRAAVEQRKPHETEADSPAATPSKAVPAHIRYYSYCTCGKPVTNRYYLLSGERAGEPIRVSGHTDWFGMLLVRDVDSASAFFGKGQRARKRHYNFVPGTEKTRHNILDALKHADPNDILTALLDLRTEPVPAAKDALVAMLDRDNEVIWRNAAVTLSYFDDVDDIVARYVAELSQLGPNTEKAAFILGALRRPSALAALDIALKSENAELRRIGAWSVGFIAHEAGRSLLVNMLADPNPQVRAEIALALGRIGPRDAAGNNVDETLEALEALMGDADRSVMQRAEEAVVRP